jgi:hypothetical protein
VDNVTDLLNKLTVRIDGLLAGQEFEADDKSGLRLQPKVYHWDLPKKRQADSPVMYGGDFPHVLLRPVLGDAQGIISSLVVLIRGGVYSSGDYASGAAELFRLLGLLLPLQHQADYSPWVQDDEYGLQWSIGNDKEGHAQPHPCHLFFAKMRFQCDSMFNNYL